MKLQGLRGVCVQNTVFEMNSKYVFLKFKNVLKKIKNMYFSCFHSLLLLEQCYIAIDLFKKKSNILS